LSGINLVFAVHMHQPVGNFPGVFEFATRSSYLPFLQEMDKNPDFKFGLHVSGPLWEYWRDSFPEIYDYIEKMVDRGQCEMLGGGFYEPILAVIPHSDAFAQLEMMSDFLYSKFKTRPRGIWLTERIWEPHLPGLLADSSIEFTCVDDYHFKSTGIVGDRLLRDFITENNGKTVRLFPISEDLRYSIPFAEPEKTLDILRDASSDSGNRLLVFADDAEKFGVWPGTNEWVWQKGWMKRFIEAIMSNLSWINLCSFSEWIDNYSPGERAYLPTGSYFEMSEWTLPPELSRDFHHKLESLKGENKMEEWKPFFKGGFWRNFLTKYNESNWMHKRMLYLSSNFEDDTISQAKRELFRSQCNCAYWHGVFGGLYLPHLRRGIFDSILKGENLLNSQGKLKRYEKLDIDLDGCAEVVLRNDDIQLFITPADGGKIAEIDLMKFNRNITDNLSRYSEGYHQDVGRDSGDDGETHSIHDMVGSKEEGLEDYLHYDWYNRRFLVDHIFPNNLDPGNFRKCRYRELGDFANQPYTIIEGPAEKEGVLFVKLRREGGIYLDDKEIAVKIEKTISLDTENDEIRVKYEIENKHKQQIMIHFGSESHFSLGSRDHPQVRLHFPGFAKDVLPGEIKEFEGIDGYWIEERADGFKIESSFSQGDIWMWPVETISNSESGFERIYQETSLLHHWKLTIPAGDSAKLDINWRISEI